MPRDEVDSSISISEAELVRQLEAHSECILARVEAAGSQELYDAATAEAQARRDNATKRAILARQQKAEELRSGRPYHEIGRKDQPRSRGTRRPQPRQDGPTEDMEEKPHEDNL